MKILNSFISAFSMYSRLPMPQIEWNEENKRYALCFFPWIGAVIGLIIYCWSFISGYLGFTYVFAAVSCAVPVLITGGIHLDGFCDVTDAKASFAPKERALEIMSDSHIGAFAAIELVIYFLLQFAFFSEISSDNNCLNAVCCSFVISRCLSGIGAVTLRCAKKEGTLQSFAKPAHRKITLSVLIVTLILSSVLMIYFSMFGGIAALIAAILTFVSYRIFAYKRFGGITGDTAGYFLQRCELAMLMAVVLGERIVCAL